MGKEHKCAYRILPVNGRYIRGFGVPKYPADKTVLTRGDKGAAVGKLQEFPQRLRLMSWMWITRSAPRRKGHGGNMFTHTSEKF